MSGSVSLRMAFVTFLVVLSAGAALAQQRSIQLDVDINKTFEAVERNKSGFDAAVLPARKQLETLAHRSADIARQISALSSGANDEQRQARLQELHAEAVQAHAEYLKQSSTIVSEASKLIAGNMSALDTLARRLEKSGDASPDIKKMQARIETQTEVGRQIIREIRAIQNLAAQDPALARRVNSLIVTASAVDRSITAQKMRMQANQLDGLDADHSRVVGMINVAVTELADMYTALKADKALLGELKEEVELAVNLGLLDLTKQVVQRSLPTLIDPTGDSVVPGLSATISNMREQNRMILTRERGAPTDVERGSAPAVVRDVPQFKNF